MAIRAPDGAKKTVWGTKSKTGPDKILIPILVKIVGPFLCEKHPKNDDSPKRGYFRVRFKFV